MTRAKRSRAGAIESHFTVRDEHRARIETVAFYRWRRWPCARIFATAAGTPRVLLLDTVEL